MISQNVLEVCNGLFREDERGKLLGLHFRIAIANQLVRVRGHERDVVGRQLTENAHHIGTQLVIARSKNGFADSTLQNRSSDFETLGILYRLHNRIFVAGETRCTVFTIRRREFKDIVLNVNGENQRHVRHQFQRFKQNLGRHSHRTFTFHVVQLNDGCHRGFKIRSRKF